MDHITDCKTIYISGVILLIGSWNFTNIIFMQYKFNQIANLKAIIFVFY